MSSTDLDAILRAARRRDPAALAALVDLYAARLFGFLYRLTASRDVAEELVQEVLVRLVRTIDTYDHTGKFEAWLFRIATNLARDRVRRARRRGVTASLDDHGDGDAPFDLPADAAGPADRVVDEESRARLADCLGRLSEPEREILLLRHYADMSFREIAELLGVPLGTALARAHRALARLRADFGVEGQA